MATVGYSGTPLAKKLGIKPGAKVFAAGAPATYRESIEPLPDGVSFAKKVSESVDVIHLFTDSRARLEATLAQYRKKMRPDATIWVSWPKKSSKVPTDITEDTVREVALPMGLVDVKVCAVDEVWSGLKLVIRKELRA
jgi:hypothetical protein